MSQESVVRWSVTDGVGQIIVNSPPVNALSTAVRRGIAQALAALQADPSVKAAVLVCEGRTFFAGADITEFGKPPQLPTLHEVMASIENAPWPVIGAIHGTALGGGLEVALVCHHRIAVPSARLGLPEVKLGLLPGGGGTQRLPRLLGVEAALDMMLCGDPISAEKALEVGLIDRMAVEGQLLESSLAFARDLVAAKQSPTRIRDRQDHLGAASRDPQIFERARAENARVRRGLLAPQLIVKAVEAAVTMDFEQGLAREWELFRELEDGRESAALRHIFFAERESAKVPGVKSDTPALDLETALIVGDGAIATRWETILRKAPLSVSRIADAVPVTSAANLVILAQERGQNPEQLSQLSGALGPETLVVLAKSSHASETDAAPRLPHPHRVLGATLANVDGGRLLEIDIGSETSADTVQTALKLARRCQLVPVAFQTEGQSTLSRLQDAFAAARKALEREGVSPADITAALAAFGFAGTSPVTDAGGQSAIVRPLLAAVANTGARLLDEGVALRPSDIDITAVEGLGWPSFTGGPMFWLDQTDIASVIADLHRLEAAGGTLFSPAARLREALASTAATAAN